MPAFKRDAENQLGRHVLIGAWEVYMRGDTL